MHLHEMGDMSRPIYVNTELKAKQSQWGQKYGFVVVFADIYN